MSGTTPAASSQSPDVTSPVAPASQDSSQSTSAADRLVLEYLRSRGHNAAEQALQEALDGSSAEEKGKRPEISTEDLIKGLAVYAQKPSKPGENIFKETTTVLQELTAMGNPTSIQNLVASLGSVGAEEILSLDPTDKQEGFRELEAWVDGSLDMYRVKLHVTLIPVRTNIFRSARISTHPVPYILPLLSRPDSIWLQRCWYARFYQGSLSLFNLRFSAHKFFSAFSSSLSSAHNSTLHRLSTLVLPTHVQTDELAQRFRNEKYAVRMSRSGFGLLVGWLTEGMGGEAAGAGEGFSGERGKRGRAAVMRVVNNHLRFDGEFEFFSAKSNVVHYKCSNCFKYKRYSVICMGRVYRTPIINNSSTKWDRQSHRPSGFQLLQRRLKTGTSTHPRRIANRDRPCTERTSYGRPRPYCTIWSTLCTTSSAAWSDGAFWKRSSPVPKLIQDNRCEAGGRKSSGREKKNTVGALCTQ